jgi:hypothetical protein
MSSPLADLQRTFLATMRGGDEGALLPRLAAGRYASPEVGLSIYRNAYAARLREALDSDHPTLGIYLGDKHWARMCDGYIAAYPSTVRSLRHFGDGLPEYLRSVEPFSANPQIAELAALERRLLDCFDAADADHAQWEALLAMPDGEWPGLRLRFHPSAQRHRVAWNTVEIWRAIKNEQTPPDSSAAINESWLFWRDEELITRFRSLDDEECIAFAHFLEGGDFSGLCDELLNWRAADAVPPLALGILHRWCLEGLVSHWLTATSPPALHALAGDRGP